MARTSRASKVSDTSGKPKPAKTKGSTAGRATAAKQSRAKQQASIVEKPPAAKKAAKAKTSITEQAVVSKKAAKAQAAKAQASTLTRGAKQGADVEAPASKQRGKQAAGAKKASKKGSDAKAPAAKKASKKSASSADAPASKQGSKKKASKKASDAEAPAAKKASKKTAAAKAAPAAKKASKKTTKKPAPVSQQLAFPMDIETPTTTPAPARPLQPGDRVPDFSLEGDDGQTYSRERLAGERFVIYFYPKDDTPGCTRQACDFRDNRSRFESASVKVLGVSGDSLKSHGRFRSKYELDFPLLSDPDRTVANAFGVVGVKKLYGKESVGIIRSSFLVGPDGVVQKVFSPVKVDGHAEAVLQAVGSG